MEITIQTLPGLPAVNLWHAQTAARTLLTDAGRANAEVSVLVCDDAHIHVLNRQWRGMDKPTDVLSWPQDAHGAASSPSGEDLLGDVVISLDTARRQAQTRDWPVEEEIALLLVHGILHLLGYEDETETGASEMRNVETRILGKPLEKVETGQASAAPLHSLNVKS